MVIDLAYDSIPATIHRTNNVLYGLYNDGILLFSEGKRRFLLVIKMDKKKKCSKEIFPKLFS